MRSHLLANGSTLAAERGVPGYTAAPVDSPVVSLKRRSEIVENLESDLRKAAGEDESSSESSSDNEIKMKSPSHKLYKRFCETSTIHGVQDYFKAKSTAAKLIWLVCIIVAFGAAMFLCAQILIMYNESPLFISYHVKAHLNGDETNHPVKDPNRLPDMVICPFNRFNYSFFKVNKP